MRDLISQIWSFEYAVVPCLLAYLLFDLPIIYRRITRKLYVPIYFAFFPYGYSDELYARYFDEDTFGVLGGGFSETEIDNARLRIIWVSVLSLALTMAISPFVAAMFSYYFLTLEQQAQFFITLAVVKVVMLGMSLYDLRWHHRVTDIIPPMYIGGIYILYLIAILTFYDRGLKWIAERDASGGVALIANDLLDFFLYDIGVGILFVGIIGFLLPWRLTKGTGQPVKGTYSSED
ncbi:hypothetical protein ACFSUD_05215 [Sulfitobacter aestuarii]|uniref:Lycopene cyclase domain-containing protein n=1 Tax=Sulfitobacter aestuarii TaxID=2161676 RepID=A0ABW5U2H6_9RHOB